jgi:acetyl esterase/lipase
MKQLSLFVLVCFEVITGNLSGQSKVIDIWQGKVPGAIVNPTYQVIADSSGSWTYMRHITNPIMDMYPAPADKSNGTAVIICPGGGYWALAYKHEGSQVAVWFNSIGITAFVLKYRLPENEIMTDKSVGPMQDGQEAIRIVRRHAKEWNIDPNKIGIMGFSAGGHLASTLSTHFSEKVYEPSDSSSARPDFSILIYPVITMDSSIAHLGSRELLLGKQPAQDMVKYFSNELQVNEATPPAFLVHSMDDNVVPVQNSINYALALRKYNIPCELHIFEKGGHGYGFGRTSDTESSWSEALMKWLQARGLL